jgi:hypothetical protein
LTNWKQEFPIAVMLVDHCFFNFSSEAATWPVQIVPMRYQAWPSYSILVSGWSIEE